MDYNRMENNIIKFKFGSDKNDIDAYTFTSIVECLSILASEINKNINKSRQLENEINIRITAIEKGSFEFVVDIVRFIKDNIFSKENVEYAMNIITILVGIYGLRGLLRKKRNPEKVEKLNEEDLKITNDLGNSLIVNEMTFNLYDKNPEVYKSLNQTFSTLSLDRNIKDFSLLTDKNVEVFKSEFKDFEELSETVKYEENGIKILDHTSKLFIARVSFDKKLTWDFYYNSMKIKAKIKCPEFQKLIENGERFAKGDMLEVKMNINQVFDKSVNTYINKSCEIIEILKHIPREQDKEIPF